MNDVTVITVTHNRVNLLKRAIESVQNQDYNGPIYHMIIVDEDDKMTQHFLRQITQRYSNVYYFALPNENEDKGTIRLAKLRNWGVKRAKTEWICFLDDDNIFARNHISSLIQHAIKHNLRAVHSYRILLNRDGTPFLGNYYPWIPDHKEAKKIYKKLCEIGVMTPGSNIVKDRANTGWVDAGEWLLRRDLLWEIPFREEYTNEELKNNVGDDDKLLYDLLVAGEPIGCTEKPTLIYYLGGYSNNFKYFESGDKYD